MAQQVQDIKSRLQEMKKREELVKERLRDVKNVIMVMSGKGGVGKSFIAANLALALAMKGKNVGVLDADFHGPDIPKFLGVEDQQLIAGPPGIFPVAGPLNVKVVSLHFMLPSEDSPIIWRGPMKSGALLQLLMEVIWGPLDYLVVDLPPGTGDEPLSVAQLIPNVKGVVLVTIPSKVAELDVKKAAGFAQKLKIPILGIVENMSYFKCPKCGAIHYIFGRNIGRELSKKYSVPLLGEIPLDVKVASYNNEGRPFLIENSNSDVGKVLLSVADKVIEALEASK